ncbi:MAG: c-type cytochrome [Flavihumibacter sp.]|nr:c-type cytochrome [Flavihumibacter sp.]
MYNRTGFFLLLFVLLGFAACKDKTPEYTTPSDPKLAALQLPEGFRAERLFGPSEKGEGSWVAMTFDNKGRLIASDQYGGLYRMSIPDIGDTASKVVAEPLRVDNFNFGYAHGLLYAFNSLYVMVNHGGDSSYPKSSGLYRLRDTDNDDQYDSVTLLKALEGEGEHGPHSIVLAPDQQSLYVIAGNFTKLPDMKTYRSSPDAQLDNLIPLLRDPNGHDNSVGMLGGWIAKVDSTGNDWELYASGFRNPFDLAFNDAGDMFTYDSDMEWDMGTPWYRPTRICHVTSGSEFGWRPGTAKWHPSFADSRPAVLNIGQGSPTNMVSGKDAAFPEKYRQALFAFDWSFGIIYAIWPTPSGSSYTAKGEEFLSGSPLPLTDGVIGPDGALYFLTGGRRLESDLYRVYYGDGHLKKESVAKSAITPENALRRELEAFHVNPDDKGRTLAWANLDHADAGIRFAARKILEQSPQASWITTVNASSQPSKLVQATLAISKQAGTGTDWDLVKNILNKIPFSELDRQQQLDLIRAIELFLSRSAKPGEATRKELAAYFASTFPLPKEPLYNRQLSKLLVYLGDTAAIQNTLKLLLEPKEEGWVEQENLTSSEDLIMRNPDYGMGIAGTLAKFPPQNQTYYATVLSQVGKGMNESLQKEYFAWFAKAFQFQGGHSYAGFINLARKQALRGVPQNRFAYFNELSGDSIANRPVVAQSGKAVQPKGPGRDWTVDDAMKYVDSGMGNRNFERGQGLFVTSLCASCHTMKGEGGVSGPDLTQLGTRFSYHDMLEAIIEPSKSISDQYGATVFYLRTGKTVMGRLIEEDEKGYTIAQNPFAPQEHRVLAKAEVVRTRLSEISPMLPNMINRLNAEELKDLLAYLKAGGNREDSLFRTK